jgi:hypothetical protein
MLEADGHYGRFPIGAVDAPIPADGHQCRPELAAQDIALPDGVLECLHRHVAGVVQHRDRLITADGTQGATASFSKELVRRAVLIGADADRDAGDDGLVQALHEMRAEAQHVAQSKFDNSQRRSSIGSG